jgi:hypothetical protein
MVFLYKKQNKEETKYILPNTKICIKQNFILPNTSTSLFKKEKSAKAPSDQF